MTKKEKYAYMAGILDGEGYIGIKRSTWGMRNRPDVFCPTYSERIQIKMSDERCPKMFQDEFGGGLGRDGKVYKSVNGFNTQKKMYVYRATDKIAIEIINTLLPFIVLKRPQALIMRKLRRSKNSVAARKRGGPRRKRRLTQRIVDYREQLCQQIKEIHRK